MKQLLLFSPDFNPTAKTLNFSYLPNFDISKLYAVINVTRNQPIYVAGAPGLGANIVNNPNVVVLSYDTSSHSPTDILNIYYDTTNFETNSPVETGGQLQKMQETMDQVLVELKMMNIILAMGMNITDDLTALRNDINNIANQTTTF